MGAPGTPDVGRTARCLELRNGKESDPSLVHAHSLPPTPSHYHSFSALLLSGSALFAFLPWYSASGPLVPILQLCMLKFRARV